MLSSPFCGEKKKIKNENWDDMNSTQTCSRQGSELACELQDNLIQRTMPPHCLHAAPESQCFSLILRGILMYWLYFIADETDAETSSYLLYLT